MTVKTCLLVTDDPDDHQTFSEAFSDVSSEAIVLNVLDSAKALDLLNSKKHIPDYLFLDLSMHGIRINTFLKSLRKDPAISGIPTVLYGLEADIGKVDEPRDMTFFNKEYGYSDLRNFLRHFMQSRSKKEGDTK
jgi:CheY-like chemotaxis protein